MINASGNTIYTLTDRIKARKSLIYNTLIEILSNSVQTKQDVTAVTAKIFSFVSSDDTLVVCISVPKCETDEEFRDQISRLIFIEFAFSYILELLVNKKADWNETIKEIKIAAAEATQSGGIINN